MPNYLSDSILFHLQRPANKTGMVQPGDMILSWSALESAVSGETAASSGWAGSTAMESREGGKTTSGHGDTKDSLKGGHANRESN